MNTNKTRAPWIVSAALLFVCSMAAVVLFCFDPSQFGFYPTCLFHKTTGLLCPGCGSLRALHQLLHGHLSAAFHFNALLVVSLPLCIGFAGVGFLRWIRGQPVPSSLSTKSLWIFVGTVLVFTVWRNLPFNS